MSDSNPSLSPTAQPLTSLLRLTRANINTDQAAASLLTGCRGPRCPISTTALHLGAARSSAE